MTIVVLGLSITSSWGNGHATTYRSLIRALAARGHHVLFLERDLEWYSANRDLASPPYCEVGFYESIPALEAQYGSAIESAQLVIVGSYVPDGIAVGDLVLRRAQGVTAFYDIDTPVTLAQLEAGQCRYLDAPQIPRYDLYLSFAGGGILSRLQRGFGARRPRPLYCSVDPDVYFPDAPAGRPAWDCGYLGTYSEDRQPLVEAFVCRPARRWPDGRFVVAGPQYPDTLRWPVNVERQVHLPPSEHRRFYNRLRYALNVTRRDMVKAGYAPSVRLFEAAACGVPIITDSWPGLDRFFIPAVEILSVERSSQVLRYLKELPEPDRREIGERGRLRVLREHTAAHRAAELEQYVREAGGVPDTAAASDLRRRAAS